jgi:hypothetical protein
MVGLVGNGSLLGFFTLEDATYNLSQNIAKELPLLPA